MSKLPDELERELGKDVRVFSVADCEGWSWWICIDGDLISDHKRYSSDSLARKACALYRISIILQIGQENEHYRGNAPAAHYLTESDVENLSAFVRKRLLESEAA